MGWFDDQIRERKLNDEQIFGESCDNIASAILNNGSYTGSKFDKASDSISAILKFYGISKPVDIPKDIENFEDQIEFAIRPFGIMRRAVKLTPGWYKDCVGAVLGFKKDNGDAVAFIPDTFGYKALVNGKTVKVDKTNENDYEMVGYCFYKPYPQRAINIADLVIYALKTRSVKDYIMIIAFMVLTTSIGLLTPKITYLLYGDVVQSGSVILLVSTMTMYICIQISTLLVNLYKNMYNQIIGTKLNISVEAAVMMRVLSLPANFFRQFSAGELSQRISYVSSLSNTIMSMMLNTGLTSLFSLAYIGSIFKYAPGLVIPALTIIAVTLGISLVSNFIQLKITKENMIISGKESGIAYAMISGVQKIRLSGSEKRAFARWAELFAKLAKNTYNPPAIVKINGVITTAVSLVGTIVMYFFAIKTGVNLAEYTAFSVAYGMVFGAFSSLVSIAQSTASIKPVIEMAKPIMDAIPEIDEKKEEVTRLNGTIELNHVSFKYNDSMPNVVDNLSLKINSGQYVAIVGKTGCGKSTIVRLLLGFEKPQKGAIYYDGKDINTLDVRSLRRKIGVVIQDGKLFSGDIYSNITIAAPWLTRDEAWEAAEIAGIAEDIRQMPMGMNTLISEGAGGISGGQRQRLFIARAIAPKPKILIFDEATSALDNITQKKVSKSLDSLKCTRIVIAHRLSTIKHCDRILYMEDGNIAEDGTYDELIALKGKFAQLVQRQRIDVED